MQYEIWVNQTGAIEGGNLEDVSYTITIHPLEDMACPRLRKG